MESRFAEEESDELNFKLLEAQARSMCRDVARPEIVNLIRSGKQDDAVQILGDKYTYLITHSPNLFMLIMGHGPQFRLDILEQYLKLVKAMKNGKLGQAEGSKQIEELVSTINPKDFEKFQKALSNKTGEVPEIEIVDEQEDSSMFRKPSYTHNETVASNKRAPFIQRMEDWLPDHILIAEGLKKPKPKKKFPPKKKNKRRRK